MTIELIYDADCPNVDKARESISAALTSLGRDADWFEWDRDDPDAPPYVQQYGSPTILVEGNDVSGEPAGAGGSCCRVYQGKDGRLDGAPSVTQILTALAYGEASAELRVSSLTGWKCSLATVPAIAAALLPAGLCPACWPAYAGLLSALGLGFLFDEAYLFPLTAVLLAVAVAALAIRAPSRRGYRPFLLGLTASAIVLIGRFVYASDAALYVGIAVLVAASIWNAWPLGKAGACCPVQTSG